MCYLLHSVITLADLDVIIKELHQVMSVPTRFIGYTRETEPKTRGKKSLAYWKEVVLVSNLEY